MEHLSTPSGAGGLEAEKEEEVANKENVDPRLHVPELNTAVSALQQLPPLQPKRKPPIRKKDSITQHRKKSRASLQPSAIQQQQQQQEAIGEVIPPTIAPHPLQNTSSTTASLAVVPPYLLKRKIDSLQNKLQREYEERVILEAKLASKERQFTLVQEALSREKKASNTLIDDEKKKTAEKMKEAAEMMKEAAEMMKEAQSMNEESKSTMDSISESIANLKMQHDNELGAEKMQNLIEHEKLIETHRAVCQNHNEIVACLKNEHKQELEQYNESMEAEASKVRMLEEEVEDLNEMIEEMRIEVNTAFRERRIADNSTIAAKKRAQKRLDTLRTEHEKRITAENNSIELAKKVAAMTNRIDELKLSALPPVRQMKKIRVNADNNKAGGGRVFPWWMVQTICEMLVNGTPPSAVSGNMLALHRAICGSPPEDLPCVNYVRHCRVVTEVIVEAMAAIKLANAPIWDELHTDSTSRRQIPFTALIIGLLGDNNVMESVVISACIFMEDETSETHAEGLVKKVSS